MRYVDGRVICKVDTQQKNHHTFKDGTTIRLERQYDNFNRRYTEQVMGTVVSAEYIPTGAMILFNHNAVHEVNEITNHDIVSGENIASRTGYYSIPESECFLWKMPGEEHWNTTKGFVIAQRVFQPYEGSLAGIAPKLLKDTLYIKSGELTGNVVLTLKSCDYEIIFRNEKGVEERIVRCRHFPDENHEREEIICVHNELTEKLYDNKLWVGLTSTDAKPLNNFAYAD